MGLITKTVKVKWFTKTKKWYISKGYKFTVYKDEFEVNVEDLAKSSHIKIQVRCDGKNCCKLLKVEWRDYLKYVHTNGKYYCRKCGKQLFGKESELKTKLKMSMSFYDWCIKHDNQYILDKWNYKLNKCSPKDVLYGSNKKYYFKCLEHPEHKSEMHNINNFTQNHIKYINCNQCNSFAQYLIDTYGDNALDKYWDYEKNVNIDPWDIKKSSNKKIWIKCQKYDYHGSYQVNCDLFTLRNERCPYCANHNGLVHPKDSLGQYIVDNYGENFLNKIWSKKNKKSAFEYSPNSGQKVWWKCCNNKHKDFYRSIDCSNKYKFRCPQCVNEMKESMLEEKVRLYLENLHIGIILHEYNCTIVPPNPKSKNKRWKMPFDNELIINNKIHLVIEVHGMQHYKLCIFNKISSKKHKTTPEYELHMQQVRDRYKRIYAKSKGYYYLAIPYWDIEDNENYKTLINNKINKIKEP